MTDKPFVSVIIPCRNEEKFIIQCLEAILSQTYPQKDLEIFVIDGMSDDRTRQLVNGFIRDKARGVSISLIDNEKRFAVFAMNIGIKRSKGEIVIRMDVHAGYSSDYVERLVGWFSDPRIGNIGGVWINKPTSGSLVAISIAYSLNHPLCVGFNKFRTGIKKPESVDTVPFGAWGKNVFKDVGLFNEELLRGEDFEFNGRLRKAGYKIILDPNIKTSYYTRETYRKLFKMMRQYGYWKVIVGNKLKIAPSFRQVIPPLFVVYLVAAVLLSLYSLWLIWLPFAVYLILDLSAGAQVALRAKNIFLIPFVFWTFIVAHIGYGLGALEGALAVLLQKKNPNTINTEITR